MIYKVFTLCVITFIFSSFCVAQKKRNGDKNESSLTQAQKDSLNTFIQIDRIFIVGNKRTKEQIIRREVTEAEGRDPLVDRVFDPRFAPADTRMVFTGCPQDR